MQTIILLSYNNYYNRIVKIPLQSASEYVLNGATVINQLTGVNFPENDGVSTSLDVLYAGSTHPDYLIIANEEGKVIQRWYIIDSIHVSGGQRKLSLLRDVIADHYSATVESPIFVEKAMLNAYDPAIFNDEGVTVNQILTRKELLSDQTGCPWIVGYIPKNFPETETSFEFDFNPVPDETVEVETEASFYSSLGEYVEENQNIIVGCLYKNSSGLYNITSLYIESTQNQISPSYFYDDSGYWSDGPIFMDYSVSGWNSTLYDSAVGKMEGAFSRYISGYGLEIKSLNLNPMSTYSALMNNIPGEKDSTFNESIIGKVIYISSTGEYKRVQRRRGYTRRFSTEITANSGASWENLTRLFNRVDDTYAMHIMSTSSLNMICDVNYSIYELVPFMSKGIATISQNRVRLNDQPYDMFCIPYSDDIYLEYNGFDIGKFQKDISMGFAQSISSALGSSASYDIQILPYCPVPNLFEIKNGKKVMHFKERASSEIETELEQVQGGRIVTSAIFWASSSSFEFSIPWRLDVPTDPVELKLIEICDKYRMASPNMSSFFDFSPMKNGGVTSIDVVCSYRPYSPYIHLNPRFGGIYSSSSGVGYEVRGLDLSGNFSLTQTSNAWTDYQLQNKNFENIFNRQMDSLELQHKVQEKFEILNAFTGAVSGAMSGGMSGAAAGPVGTVAGMIVGGVASGVAGAMDVNINRMLRQEQVSLQEDIFAYQKGNIQALPNSLTKVDTLSQNNPLIPYIEFYTCTQIEREAIKNMIRFSGMTVGRIGKISEFTASGESRYIRGKLIRIEGIEEDFHIVQQISQEIQKGIYI